MFLLNVNKNAFTNLSICDADEPLVDQFVPLWVPGLALHDVAFCCFIGERDGWNLRENKRKKRWLMEVFIFNFKYT